MLRITTKWTVESRREQMSPRLHGTPCQRQCGSSVTKLSRLEDCKGRMQTSSHSLQGLIDGKVNEVVVSTMAPSRSAVLFCWMDQGSGDCLNVAPASCLKCATCDVSFCDVTQIVGDTWATCPACYSDIFGHEAKGRVWHWSYFQLMFSFLVEMVASVLLRWKSADTVFVVPSFNFQVWRYLPTVAICFGNTPSTVCLFPPTCMIARLSVYAYVLEMMISNS